MSSLLYFFLKRANANGKHYSIITDHLGTPIEAYNQEGELIWEREQDLYGNSRQGFAKENFRCPFKYQGQYYDSEVELCYNRFRYYHPEQESIIKLKILMGNLLVDIMIMKLDIHLIELLISMLGVKAQAQVLKKCSSIL